MVANYTNNFWCDIFLDLGKIELAVQLVIRLDISMLCSNVNPRHVTSLSNVVSLNIE